MASINIFKDILMDPEFWSMSMSDRHRVLARADPDFQQLGLQDQLKVVDKPPKEFFELPSAGGFLSQSGQAITTGIKEFAGGLAALPGFVGQAVTSPSTLGTQLIQATAEPAGRAITAAGAGRYKEAAHEAEQAIPLIGPKMREATEAVERKEFGKAAGIIGGAIVPMAAPVTTLTAIGKTLGAAGRAARAIGGAARGTVPIAEAGQELLATLSGKAAADYSELGQHIIGAFREEAATKQAAATPFYDKVRAEFAEQRKTLQVGTKPPEASTRSTILDAYGRQPARTARGEGEPIFETFDAPLATEPIKSILQPVVEDLRRRPKVQNIPAFQILERFMTDARPYMGAMELEQFLGPLKEITRGGTSPILRSQSQRGATQAIDAIQTHLEANLSPAAMEALKAGRALVREAHQIENLGRSFGLKREGGAQVTEPVAVATKAIAPKDRYYARLFRLNAIAPDVVATAGKTLIQSLTDAAAGGDVAGALRGWRNLGTRTKQLLFEDSVGAIDDFFARLEKGTKAEASRMGRVLSVVLDLAPTGTLMRGVLKKGLQMVTSTEAEAGRIPAVPKKAVERIRGSVDVPLSPTGTQQAREMGAEAAARGGYDKLYAGNDLSRVRDTAQAISDATGTPIEDTGQAFHPWHLGALEGQAVTPAVIKKMNFFVEHPDLVPPPGRSGASTARGESFNTFKTRALGAVQKLIAEHEADPSTRIGVVTHTRVKNLVQAWIDEGANPDLKLNTERITAKGAHDDPGTTARLFKDNEGKLRMEKVPAAGEASPKGGIEFIRHAVTDWNAPTEVPSTTVSRLKSEGGFLSFNFAKAAAEQKIQPEGALTHYGYREPGEPFVPVSKQAAPRKPYELGPVGFWFSETPHTQYGPYKTEAKLGIKNALDANSQVTLPQFIDVVKAFEGKLPRELYQNLTAKARAALDPEPELRGPAVSMPTDNWEIPTDARTLKQAYDALTREHPLRWGRLVGDYTSIMTAQAPWVPESLASQRNNLAIRATLTDSMKRLGYDGYKALDGWVAFEPEQIEESQAPPPRQGLKSEKGFLLLTPAQKAAADEFTRVASTTSRFGREIGYPLKRGGGEEPSALTVGNESAVRIKHGLPGSPTVHTHPGTGQANETFVPSAPDLGMASTTARGEGNFIVTDQGAVLEYGIQDKVAFIEAGGRYAFDWPGRKRLVHGRLPADALTVAQLNELIQDANTKLPPGAYLKLRRAPQPKGVRVIDEPQKVTVRRTGDNWTVSDPAGNIIDTSTAPTAAEAARQVAMKHFRSFRAGK